MLSALRDRWLRIRRGWRIAILTILCAVVVIGGAGFFLYRRAAPAREFNATLLGLMRLAAAQDDKLALTDDQVRQVLVPLHRLEIQDSIQLADARQALTEIRAALTTDQLAALSQRTGLAAGGLRFTAGMPRGNASRPGLAPGAGQGTAQAPDSGADAPSATRPRLGQRALRRTGPLARVIALFRVQLPQPAFVSQVCQRLEDRLNGATQTSPN